MVRLLPTCSLIVVLWGKFLLAQTPSWQWSLSGGGKSIDNAYRVAADVSGNVFVVGSFNSDSLSLGGIKVKRSGSMDFFIAKLNSSGTVEWVRTSGTAQTSFAYGVALDVAGNVYVAGGFIGTAAFGNIVHTTPTADVFVAKLDGSGNYLWVQRSVSSAGSSAAAYDVTLNSTGQILIAGYFLGAPTIGSTTLSHPSNGQGLFVATIDELGSWRWVAGAEGTSELWAKSVTADDSGNVYVTGHFKNTAQFSSANLTSNGDHDIFVAKLNSSGQWVWAQKGGGKGLDRGISITADRQNNVYVAGTVADTATFGNHTLPTSPFTAITFLTKYDSRGIVQSVVRVPGIPGSEIGNIVTTDENNNVYLSGTLNFGTASFGSTVWQGTDAVGIFVAKMNSSGSYEWAQKCGAFGNLNFSLGRGADGAMYILGSFSGTTSVGNRTLTSLGSYDFFVAKFGGPISSVKHIDGLVPSSIQLSQNYPNPFNPSTTIAFDIPSAGAVSLTVFDLLGRQVTTLVNDHLQPGQYQTTWNATGMPSGVYLYRLQAGGFVQTRKLILQK
ncbi:MAG TPA: T9SS type A sorting domain-containing protein [Bacteroidota bacterium]|nr:T9SS type A sorting domain-containing protein [Bacteroidota bacterium]